MNKFLLVLRIIISFSIAAFLFYFVIIYTPDSKLPSHLIVNGGTGTEKDPYLISNEQQLISFRDTVNSGNKFEGCYFLQTNDLDLKDYGDWKPIGEYQSDHYFVGTYDGGGHCIKNIKCNESASDNGNIGFFGQLGGTIMNFGIDSGVFHGTSVGGIAKGIVGNALIINCYNNADIVASKRGGGIVDEFSGGSVANTWFGGTITAKISGGICSYDASMIFSCFSLGPLYNQHFTGFSKNSDEISVNDLNESKTADLLNEHITQCADFFRLDNDKLANWTMNNQHIGFNNNNM